jgi:hypothetical protein
MRIHEQARCPAGLSRKVMIDNSRLWKVEHRKAEHMSTPPARMIARLAGIPADRVVDIWMGLAENSKSANRYDVLTPAPVFFRADIASKEHRSKRKHN